MRLDRALAQVEALGDPCVGQALCHQLEHLAFALRELGERIVFAPRRDEARDYLRVERRATLGNALGCSEELADLEHAVLEQVAEAAERDQLNGVGRLDVLGEDEHTQLGMHVLELPRRPRALVGEGRRHPNVEDDEVGVLLGDRGWQPVRIPE